jgi:hypothetical protein
LCWSEVDVEQERHVQRSFCVCLAKIAREGIVGRVPRQERVARRGGSLRISASVRLQVRLDNLALVPAYDLDFAPTNLDI